MRIVLTGGGTGGHIYPIVAVAKKIREIVGDKDDVEFLFLGPKGELEEEAMNAEFIPTKNIYSGKMRRYFSLRYFVDIFKLPVGFIQSLWRLLVFMPDAIFAKGGYASVPVVLAGWLYRIPIVIHESDVTPGLANQFCARLAKRIAVSFPGAANFFHPLKVFVSGNPMRPELIRGKKEEAQKIFSLSPEKAVILILGGSQGARAINHAVLAALPKILKKRQVIHITGKDEFESVVHQAGVLGIKAGHNGYHPFRFLREELPHAFAAADLVISRAGANTLTEIAANRKPSIIIPIEESANGHQKLNAFAFAEAGAAVVLEQSNLGENILLEKIEEILENKDLKYEMSERVKKFFEPDAAKTIAEEIIKIAE
jgi:UDP-N-acetylglucosamine--N-acetylmuramyl-(pentapeptide) pyrophosphoryl-undecaprenol N-acetylglucosamine transferase